MGATCCNVLGDIACSVAMTQTVKLDTAEPAEVAEVAAAE
jgi:hypothetical protein